MDNVLGYLDEQMKYLSYVFAKSVPSNVDDADDYYQDLVVFYLENKNSKQAKRVAKQTEQKIKNYWFICFKRHLLNKYTRAVTERKIEEKLRKRYAELQDNSSTERPFIG